MSPSERREMIRKENTDLCRTSTTLSGSDNHFGRSLSRCDVAYFK
jgi:hypothetical protein